jgi:hypothetical protein
MSTVCPKRILLQNSDDLLVVDVESGDFKMIKINHDNFQREFSLDRTELVESKHKGIFDVMVIFNDYYYKISLIYKMDVEHCEMNYVETKPLKDSKFYEEPVPIIGTRLLLRRKRMLYPPPHDEIILPNGQVTKLKSYPGPVTNYYLACAINDDQNYKCIAVNSYGVQYLSIDQSTGHTTKIQRRSVLVKQPCFFNDGTIVMKQEMEYDPWLLINVYDLQYKMIKLENLPYKHTNQICSLPSTIGDAKLVSEQLSSLVPIFGIIDTITQYLLIF